MLIGSFAVVPVYFRILWGAEEFRRRIQDKGAIVGIIFLSLYVFLLFFIIVVRLYMNLR